MVRGAADSAHRLRYIDGMRAVAILAVLGDEGDPGEHGMEAAAYRLGKT